MSPTELPCYLGRLTWNNTDKTGEDNTHRNGEKQQPPQVFQRQQDTNTDDNNNSP